VAMAKWYNMARHHLHIFYSICFAFDRALVSLHRNYMRVAWVFAGHSREDSGLLAFREEPCYRAA